MSNRALYPSLKGKRVFISGGASGIGEGFVEAFVAQGAHVAFCDIAQEAGETVAKRLGADAAFQPHFHRCDLRDVEAVQAMMAQVEAELGGIDIVINNAANDDRHSVADVTPAYWDERMAVNLRHQFFVAQAAAPAMKRAGGGAIINLGSISWHLGLADLVLYETAKAAIEGMTRGLARELGRENIRVTAIIPGNVKTPRQEQWYTPEGEAEIVAAQCMDGRLLPADVAALALFLASDDARLITGHNYWVDAGWRWSPEPVWELGATLGEGPVWVAREAALWFVDIKAPAIHRFDPSTGAKQSWDVPAQVGWVLPSSEGGMIAGLQSGVHRFDPASGRCELIHAPEAGRPGNRLNDATVAADGAIWFGSMDDAEQDDTGRIWRLHGGICADTGLPPVSITNGPAFSPDGATLYHHDTLGRKIWASSVENGKVTATRLFADIEDGAGYPDGPTVDAEGCLWVGLFAGWAVRRYDPSGRLIATIPMPVANITKVAFGGSDLRTAYATTASKGLSEAQLAAQPLAGALFAFDAGVAGLEGHVARV